VRRVLGDGAWERLGDDARRRRRAEGRAFVEEAREQLIPLFHLDEITVPCVVAVGADTWPYMVDVTRRVADELGAELMPVPGAGHFGHVTHPDAFAALVRRTLALSR
jgi:pimeloyl-ACP methyl ester carboxylesterase